MHTIITKIITVWVSIMALFAAESAAAQKIISGSYVYRVPENISLNEARHRAVEKARVQALADTFGTIVDMTNYTSIRNSTDASSVDMISISESEVKGEWLADVDEPVCDVDFEDGQLIVTAKVKGKAREIKTAAIDFQAKVLRNGIENRHESYEFVSGDDLYMSFRSPISGYLAVYLWDGGKNAYCLVPYSSQAEGCFEVKAGKGYVLFSSKSAGNEISSNLVDEFNVTCSQANEMNMIYVLFSPNMFTKAMSDNDGGLQEMDFKSFQKWLLRVRAQDEHMQVERKTIMISSKK